MPFANYNTRAETKGLHDALVAKGKSKRQWFPDDITSNGRKEALSVKVMFLFSNKAIEALSSNTLW